MDRPKFLAIVGGIAFVVGAALRVVGGTSDGRGVPRFVSLALILAGVVSLAGSGGITLRARRHGADDTVDAPRQDRRERRRALSVRLVVAGLLLFPASVAIAGAAGNSPYVVSFAPPAIIALLIAVIVWVTGRLFVPALVVAIPMFLLFGLLVGIGDFAHPESFADFVPAFWRSAGLGVAVAAAIVAIRQRRAGTLAAATQRQRRLVGVGVVVLVAASAASFFVDRTSRTTIARADGAIVVNTLEDDFDPETIEVEVGRQRFLIRNEDSYAHTFTIDDLELDQYVAPGSDRFVTVTFDRTGTYELYCAVTGHEDMTGTIEVDQS